MDYAMEAVSAGREDTVDQLRACHAMLAARTPCTTTMQQLLQLLGLVRVHLVDLMPAIPGLTPGDWRAWRKEEQRYAAELAWRLAHPEVSEEPNNCPLEWRMARPEVSEASEEPNNCPLEWRMARPEVSEASEEPNNCPLEWRMARPEVSEEANN